MIGISGVSSGSAVDYAPGAFAGVASTGAGAKSSPSFAGQEGGTAAADDTAASSVVRLSADGKAAADADKPGQLTPDEQDEVRKLKARDREVRAHELAHQAAAGGLAGGASFSYQRGPDGVSYAVGGEVSISVRPGRTPEETVAIAQTVRAAALAPAEPSGQDRAVAAAASQLEAEARAEQTSAAREGDDGVPAEISGGASNAASNDEAPSADDGSTAGRVARAQSELSELYGRIAGRSSGFSASA